MKDEGNLNFFPLGEGELGLSNLLFFSDYMALGRIFTYVCICGGDRSSVERRGLEKLRGSFQCEPSGVLQKDSHGQAE